MQAHLVAGVIVACATVAVGAQTASKSSSSQAAPASPSQATTPSPSAIPSSSAQTSATSPLPATSPKNPVKAVTLRGCLRGSSDPGTGLFTLEDRKGETTYSFTGTDVTPHVGHRVKIVGGPLLPPTVWAQAGAIDPVQAAIAGSEHVAGPGNVHLE